MREPWQERLRQLVCRVIGHRPEGEVLLDGSQWCKRCGRSVKGRR